MRLSKSTVVGVLVAAAWSGVALGAPDLEESFRHPPDTARAQVWWHRMNGNISKRGITKDLEAMKQAGLGGFEVFDVTDGVPVGPVKYDSKAWHELMAHAASEAGRLGLQMCVHNCAGWSSSGGPWITPDHSMFELVWSERRVTGERLPAIALKQPATRLGYYRDIAVLAFPTPANERGGKPGYRLPDWKVKSGAAGGSTREPCRFPREIHEVDAAVTLPPERIIDLTPRMNRKGELTWTPPTGDYTIVRFGYTTTGKTNHPAPAPGLGLECDKLSKDGADLHWNHIVKRIMADAGPHTGHALNDVLIDSYEVGRQNWTHDFAAQFRRRRGYDITPWLVCMTGRVLGSVERTERFLWDLRRTIADLMTENYFGRFAELCHQNGLVLSIEPYGNGGFDGFQAAMAADIPMGEWWVNRPDAWHDFSAKLASSAAHIDGKRYVGAESFTAGGRNAAWINYPYSIKAQGDERYTRGVNRYIFHTCVHQPWADEVLPGMTMGPHGMQMNRNNTWFLHARPWFDRLARCQFMLQEGRFVADLLYIYGEDAPNTNDARQAMVPAPPAGYDYDVGGFQTLMKASVKDGRVTLPSGMSYRVLILTRAHRMRPAFIRKVSDLVAAGAVVVGEKPTASPSLEDFPSCDATVNGLADRLWRGKQVRPPEALGETLASLLLAPDFETPGEEGVRTIHRRIGDADVYFVSNQGSASRSVRCIFRIAARLPEIWRPDDGHTEPAAQWEALDDGRTAVTLAMGPAGSVFVVFRKPAGGIDPVTELVFTADTGKAPPEASLKLVRAWYGDPDNATRRTDVTDILRQRLQTGQPRIVAGNAAFGDPARLTVKILHVEYECRGKPMVLTVNEKQTLDLGKLCGDVLPGTACEARVADGAEQALVYRPGTLTVRRQSGKTASLEIADVPPALEVKGPWTVTFGPMGPPKPVTFNELVPWNEHAEDDIRHFSGAATYQTTFELPAARSPGPSTGSREGDRQHAAFLDLGRVEIMARVTLNGRDLGLLWKPPFRVDLGDAVKSGKNELEVTVVNLWVNRLIGDERYPDLVKRTKGGRRSGGLAAIPAWLTEGKPMPATKRKTFAAWKHWNKGDPLLPSGLIGPVRVYTPVVRSLR